MDDPGRCNVSMTRGKAVFWVLGGKLDVAYEGNRNEPLLPYAALKKQMERDGKVHELKP